MPAGGKFQLGFAVAAGYDPGDVAAWRVELAARYGATRTPWVGSVVTVTGQDFSFEYDPTEASDDDEDVTLADVAEGGNCAWSVTALDGDDLPLWRVQGDVDFVEGVGDPDTGNGSGAGDPILIRVDEGDTITLSISTGADGDASYTYIGYAEDDEGAGFATTPGETRNYVAFLTTSEEIETPGAEDFAGLWQQYKGGEGTGDVAGPASAVAGNFASYSGVSGKLLQDSGSNSASFAAASHSHAIADVTNLQTTLNGKAATSHSHSAFTGDSGSGGVAGFVPAPAAGDAAAGKYLDADGTWTVPPAGGGGVADGDKGDITVSASGATWTIDNSVVTLAKMADMATASLLGRNTAGTGAPEVLSASTARSLLNVADGANNYSHPNHTGDVTSTGDGATTIATDAVTYAKLQNISATSRVIGRKSSGSGDAEECTLSEVLDFVGSAAQGDILYRGASSWTRLAAGTSGHYLKTLGSGANPEWAAVPTKGQLGIVIDGAGSTITTGVKGYLRVPYNCTITSVELVANASGSIVVDVWKDTYANFPPVVGDTIVASAKPTLSSAQKSQDTTLTGWTTSLTEGDYLAFNVDSATTVSRVTLSLVVTRTT